MIIINPLPSTIVHHADPTQVRDSTHFPIYLHVAKQVSSICFPSLLAKDIVTKYSQMYVKITMVN